MKSARELITQKEGNLGMKDGKLSDFIDGLHYGSEMLFLFRGTKFFIQGWWRKQGTAEMAVADIS